MAVDEVLIKVREKLAAAPNLTDEEYRKKMSHMNDEDSVDDINFDAKDYDILEHIVLE